MTSPVWSLFVANLSGVLIGLAALVGWFRKWVKTNIQEPVKRVESSMDNLQSVVETAKQDAQRAYDRAQEAHNRLDKHLEGGAHNG